MKKVFLVLVFLLIVGLVYLQVNGLFRSVEIREDRMPGYRVVGFEHRGPYERIGSAFERVQALADSMGVPVKLIGIYFDNPDEVPSDSLRSIAGLIVSQDDSLKLAQQMGVVATSIPPGTAATVDFETEGMVAMIIGAMKAYPALSRHMEASGNASQINFVYEVYSDKSTRYVMQYAPK